MIPLTSEFLLQIQIYINTGIKFLAFFDKIQCI